MRLRDYKNLFFALAGVALFGLACFFSFTWAFRLLIAPSSMGQAFGIFLFLIGLISAVLTVERLIALSKVAQTVFRKLFNWYI